MFKNIDQNTFIGRKLIYLPSCHSTNDEALALIKDDKPAHGIIIITSDQTKGRGQRGNQWLAKPGKNLTFSIIFEVSFLKQQGMFNLNMAISLGIINSLDLKLKTENSKLKVKWPNDIYYEEKKLGGILIENVFRGDGSVWSVVGIGININQDDFNYLNATSLSVIGQSEYDLQDVLNSITDEIEKCFELLKTDSIDRIKPLYLHNLYKFNINQMFKANEQIFEGIIRDVDDTGKLVIEHDRILRSFDMQEVKFLK